MKLKELIAKLTSVRSLLNEDFEVKLVDRVGTYFDIKDIETIDVEDKEHIWSSRLNKTVEATIKIQEILIKLED